MKRRGRFFKRIINTKNPFECSFVSIEQPDGSIVAGNRHKDCSVTGCSKRGRGFSRGLLNVQFVYCFPLQIVLFRPTTLPTDTVFLVYWTLVGARKLDASSAICRRKQRDPPSCCCCFFFNSLLGIKNR